MSGFVNFDLTMFDDSSSRNFPHFSISNVQKFDSSEQKTRQFSFNSNQLLSDVMKWFRRDLESRIFSISFTPKKGFSVLGTNTHGCFFSPDPCDLEGRIFSILRYAQNGLSSVGNNPLMAVLFLATIKHKTVTSKMLLALDSMRRLVIIQKQCNWLFFLGMWIANERLSRFILHRLTR